MCEQNSSHFTCLTLIKQARPVSVYKTERFSTLVSDEPCHGKMHISFHPWKKRQSGIRKSFACFFTSTHTNTHSHSLSPTPSTSVHQHLPTPLLQPLPSYTTYLDLPIPIDNILMHLCPFILKPYIHTPSTTHTPHTPNHPSCHTPSTFPTHNTPTFVTVTPIPNCIYTPTIFSSNNPPPTHTHTTVIFTHGTNSMTESSTRSSGFAVTWTWIQPPAKLELGEPGKNYWTFQSLNFLEAIKWGL